MRAEAAVSSHYIERLLIGEGEVPRNVKSVAQHCSHPIHFIAVSKWLGTISGVQKDGNDRKFLHIVQIVAILEKFTDVNN